jgi:hypothetical protein
MRGAGKTIKEAERFLETFGIEDGEAADAIARSANMLREAKGNGRDGARQTKNLHKGGHA